MLATISNRDKHNDVYVCVAAIGRMSLIVGLPPLPPPDREIHTRCEMARSFFAVDWSPDAAAAAAPMSEYIYLETPDLQATLGFHSGGLMFTLDDLERAVLATAQIVDRCATRLKS